MNKDDIQKYNIEGDKLVKKAEKAVQGSAFGNLFSSKSARVEEGIEFYKRALDNFKLAKNWTECAIVNLECAKLSTAIGEIKDASNFSSEAGDFFMKAKEEDRAVEVYKESVEGFKKQGAFDQAANLLKKIGEYYEKDEDSSNAAEYFKAAADLYSLAKYHTTDANKLQLKVAEIYSQEFDDHQKLKEAIKIYEEVADGYLSNNLMKFHSKDLFVRATLIFLLLDDDIGAEKQLEKYADSDPALNSSYELKFLKNLIKAYKEKKADEFNEAVAQLIKRTTVDNPMKNMLGFIKKSLTGAKKTLEEESPL